MKRFIVETSDDGTDEKLRGLLYLGNESERADAVHYMLNIIDVSEIKEKWLTHDGKKRMTTKQRDRLWVMCGNYNVPFREDDYFFDPVTEMVEGWVGGSDSRNKTIYVGVEKDGRSHT